jgi:serine/arginine repetitive matrix protein 2
MSESDGFEGACSPSSAPMRLLQKRNSTSVPNSPSKAYEFFSENDFSSGGDFNECNLKRGSNNSSKSSKQQDEILKNYQELQKKINLEFEKKKCEWEKMRPLVIQLNNSVPTYLKEDLSLPSTPKHIISNINLNEENLSADFKKKLDEWRTKKNQQSMKENAKKQGPQPDWQLWKTGQMKFENQGLIPLPDAKDLPEDFQKKLSETFRGDL